jgi:hypothetical protein
VSTTEILTENVGNCINFGGKALQKITEISKTEV